MNKWTCDNCGFWNSYKNIICEKCKANTMYYLELNWSDKTLIKNALKSATVDSDLDKRVQYLINKLGGK